MDWEFFKLVLQHRQFEKPCTGSLSFLWRTVSSVDTPRIWPILILANLALWKSSFYFLFPSVTWAPFFSLVSPGFPGLSLVIYPVLVFWCILTPALYSRCLCLPFLTHLFPQLISLPSASHGGHCTRCQGYRTKRFHAFWRFPSSDGVRGNKETCDEGFETNKRLRWWLMLGDEGYLCQVRRRTL